MSMQINDVIYANYLMELLQKCVKNSRKIIIKKPDWCGFKTVCGISNEFN